MPDPRLVSAHLAAVPDRREAFRAARDRLQAACGDPTAAGDAPPAPDDGPTEEVGPALCWLRDGAVLYPLAVGVNLVGRRSDNAVVVPDGQVSRRHCAVVVHPDGRAEVHDVASKNGTVVNGHTIAGPTRLHTGDQLVLGGKPLVFLAGPRDGG